MDNETSRASSNPPSDILEGTSPKSTFVTFPVCDAEIPDKIIGTQSERKIIGQLSRKRLVDEGGHSASPSLTTCLPSVMVGHGFIWGAIRAFSEHYPFSIRSQHVWIMILQAVALHINAHAEELRDRWVEHEGKKTLEVIRDGFCFGSPNDWQGVITDTADCFLEQIKQNLVEGA